MVYNVEKTIHRCFARMINFFHLTVGVNGSWLLTQTSHTDSNISSAGEEGGRRGRKHNRKRK